MASIFLKEHERRREPVISFLFLEIFQAKQDALLRPDSAVGDQLQILGSVFVDLDMEPTQERVAGTLRRLSQQAKAHSPGEQPVEDVKMGQVISAYLQGLDPAQLCLLAAGFDLAEARRLYCVEDFESVQFAAGERTRWEMTQYYSRQEAIAIGFGGVPEDDGASGAAKKPASGATTVAAATTESLNDRLGFLRGLKH